MLSMRVPCLEFGPKLSSPKVLLSYLGVFNYPCSWPWKQTVSSTLLSSESSDSEVIDIPIVGVIDVLFRASYVGLT